MSDPVLTLKFNETYRSINKIFSFIDNYKTFSDTTFTNSQKDFLDEVRTEINNFFEKFLKENSIEVLNLNIINFYLSDLENIVENLRKNNETAKIDFFTIKFETFYQKF